MSVLSVLISNDDISFIKPGTGFLITKQFQCEIKKTMPNFWLTRGKDFLHRSRDAPFRIVFR